MAYETAFVSAGSWNISARGSRARTVWIPEFPGTLQGSTAAMAGQRVSHLDAEEIRLKQEYGQVQS